MVNNLVDKSVLISGSGIAGLTTAWWLKKYGFNPTIIEHASGLRKGGYMIDFWGVGYDITEKMGLLEELKRAHYEIAKLAFVNEENKKVGGFNIRKMRKRLNFRHVNLLRSDLEQILYNHVKDKVNILYNLSIDSIEQSEKDISVKLSDGSTKTFDYIVGADGQHSNVRNLLFGPEHQFEKFLGYYTASYTLDNFLDEDRIFYSYTIPKTQIGLYSIRGNRIATFFIWRSHQLEYPHHDVERKKRILRETFQNIKWYTPDLLNALDKTADFYFDAVSQIDMNQWYNNRVVLVGDACQCVSLIAGEGSGLAMAGSYILAGELKASNGDHQLAFENYQKKMKPEIVRKQAMAQDFAGTFVPDTKTSLWFRNKMSGLITAPIFSKYFINRFLSDTLVFDDY